MERFVIIVNGRKPLTIITKLSILDVAAVLDPPLIFYRFYPNCQTQSNRITMKIMESKTLILQSMKFRKKDMQSGLVTEGNYEM